MHRRGLRYLSRRPGIGAIASVRLVGLIARRQAGAARPIGLMQRARESRARRWGKERKPPRAPASPNGRASVLSRSGRCGPARTRRSKQVPSVKGFGGRRHSPAWPWRKAPLGMSPLVFPGIVCHVAPPGGRWGDRAGNAHQQAFGKRLGVTGRACCRRIRLRLPRTPRTIDSANCVS